MRMGIDTEEKLAKRIKSADAPSAWAYIRAVPGDKLTLVQQQRAIIRHCGKAGIEQPEFVVDRSTASNSVLGSPGLATVRPLFFTLLGYLSSRRRSTLLITSKNRLSDVGFDSDLLRGLLRRRGVQVECVGPGAEPPEPDLQHLFDAWDEYERAIAQARRSSTARIKSFHGQWSGGRPPFGYTVFNGDLAIDRTTVNLIEWVFYLRDECSRSYSQILDIIQKRFALDGWYTVRIARLMDHRSLYLGEYCPRTNARGRQRPDLRILPKDWVEWKKMQDVLDRYSSQKEANARAQAP